MATRNREPAQAGDTLDEIDRKILSRLMQDGRITWADLASEIGMSPPSTIERVRKLQESGIIQGYVARLDALAVGQRLLAFVSVSLTTSTDHAKFRKAVGALAEVQECHVIAGESDYLLKVRCRDAQHLELLLRTRIRHLPGVERTSATIALTTTKETTALGLD